MKTQKPSKRENMKQITKIVNRPTSETSRQATAAAARALKQAPKAAVVKA